MSVKSARRTALLGAVAQFAASVIFLSFIDLSAPRIGNVLPSAFGLLLAVLGTISFLIGWHGARVELGEREIVAS